MDYSIMTFNNEQVSPIGEITKQHRIGTKQKDIIDFKAWCIENGKKPSAGASVREYCTTHQKGMIQ